MPCLAPCATSGPGTSLCDVGTSLVGEAPGSPGPEGPGTSDPRAVFSALSLPADGAVRPESPCLLFFQTLLDLGASPDYKDSYGLTPLYHTAVVGGDPGCCELLLHEHASVCCKDENGWHEVHQVRGAPAPRPRVGRGRAGCGSHPALHHWHSGIGLFTHKGTFLASLEKSKDLGSPLHFWMAAAKELWGAQPFISAGSSPAWRPNRVRNQVLSEHWGPSTRPDFHARRARFRDPTWPQRS